MSRHNYTNPAFCQEEYCGPVTPTVLPPLVRNSGRSPARVHRSESIRSFHSVASHNRSQKNGSTMGQRINSGYSLNSSYQHQTAPLSLPPRPGPKPTVIPTTRIVEGNSAPPQPPPYPAGSRFGSLLDFQSQSTQNAQITNVSSGRYALVPVEELERRDHGRYAVLPAQTAQRFVKSQENLAAYNCNRKSDDEDSDDNEDLPHNYSAQFASLPPVSSPKIEGATLAPAFSTDFGSKSFIIFDQKNQQRYAVVPTEENEEIVDDNHEIIQMHNGKAHRYAVIPTEEDEVETCLNGKEFIDRPLNINNRRTSPVRTPQKMIQHSHQQQILMQEESMGNDRTPRKNAATMKLHELLTTPQKTRPIGSSSFVRQNSTPVRNSPYRVKSHHVSNPRLTSSTPNNGRNNNGCEGEQQRLTPQRLNYDQKVMTTMMAAASTTTLNMEQRTTAVIQPRLHSTIQASDYGSGSRSGVSVNNIYNETTTTTNTSLPLTEKSWKHPNHNLKSSHHVATATIGIVSLLLVICGIVNSGLCLYMTSVTSTVALYTGKSRFLDIGIVSGFATVALGYMGFQSRHSDWFPNRNYVSGYILVTLSALLNCCGFVFLLATKPTKGTPIHDVATGVILGLESLTLLLISLGVVTSKVCRSPPPDNRVDVY